MPRPGGSESAGQWERTLDAGRPHPGGQLSRPGAPGVEDAGSHRCATSSRTSAACRAMVSTRSRFLPRARGDCYGGLDTLDYYQIDPAIGTMADFQELVARAHGRGMRVVAFLNIGYGHEASPAFLWACDDVREGRESSETRMFVWSETGADRMKRPLAPLYLGRDGQLTIGTREIPAPVVPQTGKKRWSPRPSLPRTRTVAWAARARITQGRVTQEEIVVAAETCVGIDVAKAALDLARRPDGAVLHVPNDEAGIAQLVTHVRQTPPTLIVLEATGDGRRQSPRPWPPPALPSPSSIRARSVTSPRRPVTSPRPTRWMRGSWRTLPRWCARPRAPCPTPTPRRCPPWWRVDAKSWPCSSPSNSAWRRPCPPCDRGWKPISPGCDRSVMRWMPRCASRSAIVRSGARMMSSCRACRGSARCWRRPSSPSPRVGPARSQADRLSRRGGTAQL